MQQHPVISSDPSDNQSIIPDKCVLLPAGTRRGALPAPAQQDGGLCFSSSASAREHNPLHPAPLPSLARVQGAGCAALSLLLRPLGKEQCRELGGTHRPFSHHLFPLPPSSDAVNAWTCSRLIIHHQLLLKQPQTKLKKPLRLQDINSSQHERQM